MEDYLNEKVPYVVCLMETKLNTNIELTNTGRGKYDIQRKEKEFKRGGVMILTNTRIKS